VKNDNTPILPKAESLSRSGYLHSKAEIIKFVNPKFCRIGDFALAAFRLYAVCDE
jgi:hypothetical protein